MFLITDLRRAFTSNLRTISATGREQARLQTVGIHEPTVQRYFAWRRSMALTVVLATLLSAGLATYRTLTEPEDRPGMFEAMSREVIERSKSALVPNAAEAKTAVDAAVSAVDEAKALADEAKTIVDAARTTIGKEIVGNERVKAALEKLKATVEDVKAVRKNKQEEDDSDDEPAASQSPARPSAVAADSTADEDDPDDKPPNAFGRFEEAMLLATLYALPVAALAVVVFWTRFQFTFRILMAGFAFAFVVPLLFSFCPWSWWGYPEPKLTPGQQPAQYFQDVVEGILEGVEHLLMLLPTVLALIPGVQRACLRVKTLLPESMLPGWFMVAASPFYALFLLVMFVGINQAISAPLFLVGMFLFLAGPMIYVFKAEMFTSPLSTEADRARIRHAQAAVGGVTALAGALVVAYFATQDMFGVHLVGLNAKTSLLRPLDLVEFFLEVVSRSMFVTVLGADLFMWMSVTEWKNSKAFAGTPGAAAYDRVMEAMREVT